MLDVFIPVALTTILMLLIIIAASMGSLKRDIESLKVMFHNHMVQAQGSQRAQTAPPQQYPAQQQQPVAMPQPMQQPQQQSMPQPVPQPMQQPVAMPQPMPQPLPAPQPVPQPLPQQHPAPALATAATATQATVMPVSQPSFSADVLPQAPQPRPAPVVYPAPQPPAYPVQPPVKKSAENIFGRNILGIVASVLVFLGFVFLGFLVVPNLTDTIKIILMFLLSAALTVGGFMLNRRFSNNFTKALLGTGCGAFFISILLTHLYFHVLGDLAAFGLLLVWIAASLFISRQTQSLLVGIISHVGMIVSVCAGYMAGMSDDKVLLLLAYQLVSTVLIVGGNILCCKKMYRFGLFASLALTIFASSVMWGHFWGHGPAFASQLPVPLVTAAFLLQFVGSSFLSYLLFVSCARVKDAAYQLLLQGLNTLLWVGALFLNITVLAYRLYWILTLTNAAKEPLFAAYDPLPWMLVITLLLLFAVAAAVLVVRRALNFSKTLEATTVVLLVGVSCMFLLLHLLAHSFFGAAGPSLSYLIIPAILLMVAKRFSKNEVYALAARIVLGGDIALMLVNGYSELQHIGTLWLSLAYLLLTLALAYLSYKDLAVDKRVMYEVACKLLLLFLYQVSLADILLRAQEPYSFALWMLLCAVVLLVLHVLKQDTPLFVFRINEFVIVLLSAEEIAFGDASAVSTVLHIATAALCFAILLERVRKTAQATAAAARDASAPAPQTDIEFVTALALTFLFLALIEGLTNWFDQSYALSLAAMFIALVIVALGFWSRARSLRLFGLGLVVLSVLKLVTFDIADLNSLMRVIAFIDGGAICFGISALYNFAVKRFDKTEVRPLP